MPTCDRLQKEASDDKSQDDEKTKHHVYITEEPDEYCARKCKYIFNIF